MKIAAIVPAAGRGRRLKTKQPKAFVPLLGKPLLIHTLTNLKRSFPFEEMIVAAAASRMKSVRRLLARYRLGRVRVVRGGGSRAESVRNGVASLSVRCEWVLIHDAARPFVGRGLVRRLLQSARRTGAAICVLPATATVRRIDPKRKVALGTEDRESLVLVQTPQVFKKNDLLARYKLFGKKALAATDEAALFDGSRIKVSIVPGEPRNIKITTKEDLELCRFYMKNK
ncbi:MAG: 2-C-methyl-D-erythritol 4-phosphate cytidylyltransferase [Candidatus Omnitrophota bacterium]